MTLNSLFTIKRPLAKFNFSRIDNGLNVMTETVTMGMENYKYHLNLHNIYSPLATTNDLPDDNNFEPFQLYIKCMLQILILVRVIIEDA
jgi:hypothetical protein